MSLARASEQCFEWFWRHETPANVSSLTPVCSKIYKCTHFHFSLEPATKYNNDVQAELCTKNKNIHPQATKNTDLSYSTPALSLATPLPAVVEGFRQRSIAAVAHGWPLTAPSTRPFLLQSGPQHPQSGPKSIRSKVIGGSEAMVEQKGRRHEYKPPRTKRGGA